MLEKKKPSCSKMVRVKTINPTGGSSERHEPPPFRVASNAGP